jgi:DNA processing protein
MKNEHFFLLALNRVAQLTPRERLALWQLFSAPSDIFKLSKDELAGLLRRRIRGDWWQPGVFTRQAGQDLSELAQGRLQCLTWLDPAYPPLLKTIYDPPLVLYYRGNLPDWQKTYVGIVGTRHPTGAAGAAAFRLAWDLSRQGVGVVSGLAKGIDLEAHAGCLEGQGPCLAVLGNGIDAIYPPANRAVARRMLEKGGLILSEYPPGTPPLKYNFPARNRIISGLSRAVVVVQAPERSGALITADYALEQGRELVVHSAGLQGKTGAGTLHLFEEGAEAITGAGELLAKIQVNPALMREASGLKTHNFSTGPAGDYLTKNLDFVNLKQAGLILAKMMEQELKGEAKMSHGQYWEKI